VTRLIPWLDYQSTIKNIIIPTEEEMDWHLRFPSQGGKRPRGKKKGGRGPPASPWIGGKGLDDQDLPKGPEGWDRNKV